MRAQGFAHALAGPRLGGRTITHSMAAAARVESHRRAPGGGSPCMTAVGTKQSGADVSFRSVLEGIAQAALIPSHVGITKQRWGARRLSCRWPHSEAAE